MKVEDFFFNDTKIPNIFPQIFVSFFSTDFPNEFSTDFSTDFSINQTGQNIVLKSCLVIISLFVLSEIN